ncbi:MAG: tRNA pseudouridine(38-40) synthase TruA [Chlamydiales bacterium]|nr:tRNA pseudouridine(38-40) synthase TruA [Chlamydiales bacterium]
MPKYRFTLSYDGTDYVGWQIQPNGRSIQGLLEEALKTLLGEKTRVYGAGRTDAGAHALEQSAHFLSEAELDCEQALRSLNGMLPYDIRLLQLFPAPETFHAQYSAVGKDYHYHLWLGPTISPFVRRYRHQIGYPLDLKRMNLAAQEFVGTHDFATFANLGSSVKTTVRTIKRLDIIEQEGGVRLEFQGDGFLYKMVRNIVGTLIEVASGRREFQEICALLEAKDRRAAGIAAPARGLFLVRVHYLPRSSKLETCSNFLSNS